MTSAYRRWLEEQSRHPITKVVIEAARLTKRAGDRAVGPLIRRALRYPPRRLPLREQMALARRAVQPHTLQRGPWVISGLLTATVGIGEGARLFYNAFGRLGSQPCGLDFSSAFPMHDKCQFDFAAAPLDG